MRSNQAHKMLRKEEVRDIEATRSHTKFPRIKLVNKVAKVSLGPYGTPAKFRMDVAVLLTILSALVMGGQIKAQGNRSDDPITAPTSFVDSASTLSPIISDLVSTTTEFINADKTIGSDPSFENQAQKLKPVNFTLVDEIFESSNLNDEEVARRWKNMDAQLQDGMKSILKLLFPQIVAISQDAKVSGDCSGGILKWILNLRNLRSWAIKSKSMSVEGITSLESCTHDYE